MLGEVLPRVAALAPEALMPLILLRLPVRPVCFPGQISCRLVPLFLTMLLLLLWLGHQPESS